MSNQSEARAPTRYHPLLVSLHWVLAILVIAAWMIGTFWLKPLPNSSPDKILVLRGHMIAGGLILILMTLRLAVRIVTRHPPLVTTGYASLDRLAPLLHWALYILVLTMAGSGIAMSVMAHLPDVVFRGSGTLPANFDAFPPRAVHGLGAKLLLATVGLHVAAALYHQLLRRDGLWSRMWFGSR